MSETGEMNIKPNIQILKDTAAIIYIDADHAFGPVVTVRAMKQAIEKAKQAGIGWCLIRNVTHQGAIGYYSLMAAKADMAGIAIACNPPNMAPYGAKAKGLHNSPISIAIPAKRHRPVLLDMATSVAAGGKLSLAIDKGIPIPEGWAIDKDGNPATDPRQATTLLPFGGPKGSGLAMMFECLTSIMANNPLVVPSLMDEPQSRRHTQNSVVAAINIGIFSDTEIYKNHVDTFIDCLKDLPKADGFDEIFVPGELEDRCYDERMKNGIPLPDGTIQNLKSISQKLDVALPDGL